MVPGFWRFCLYRCAPVLFVFVVGLLGLDLVFSALLHAGTRGNGGLPHCLCAPRVDGQPGGAIVQSCAVNCTKHIEKKEGQRE